MVGIIDYMRQYDIIKRMERMGKSVSMIAGQAEPTIVQPSLYKTRFQQVKASGERPRANNVLMLFRLILSQLQQQQCTARGGPLFLYLSLRVQSNRVSCLPAAIPVAFFCVVYRRPPRQ